MLKMGCIEVQLLCQIPTYFYAYFEAKYFAINYFDVIIVWKCNKKHIVLYSSVITLKRKISVSY